MKPDELISKRKALRASQHDLAYHSGIAQPNIAAMERGKRVIGKKVAAALEKGLRSIAASSSEVDDWWALRGSDIMSSPKLAALRRTKGIP